MSEPPAATSEQDWMDALHPYDVVFGRTRTAMRHDGNIYFRKPIRENRESYQESYIRDEKSTIVQNIAAHIREQAGKFLKKEDDG